MGKIKFEFLESCKIIISAESKFQFQANVQQFNVMYGVSIIEKNEFEGEDFLIKFELPDDIREINWNNINYPNSMVKGKISEIVYYNKKAYELEDLLNKIQYCTFEQRNLLESLSITAMNLIRSLNDHKYFTNSLITLKFTADYISHTLNKEVDSLLSLKSTSSYYKKNEALESAKSHLKQDIKGFVNFMRKFDVE